MGAFPKQDSDFYELRCSTVWGVFIPTLQHRFKYVHVVRWSQVRE